MKFGNLFYFEFILLIRNSGNRKRSIVESGILDFDVRNAGPRIRSPRLPLITFYGAKIMRNM